MTTKTMERRVADLNGVFSEAVRSFTPPEDLTVSEWADKYRKLSPESSAESGQWRTSRTPYLEEPMDAFTDPKVRRIVIVAGSQIGKTEAELNCLGYIIDQDPGTVLFLHPTIDDAKKFSKLRVAPMIRDTKCLTRKVSERASGKDVSKTILNKSFPGGMLIMAGSNSASALASTPARYVIGDERDRWALSAGSEGDPWKLAEARQTTFYNAKSIEVSTPTVKGASAIEKSFNEGTQERWCSQCPECGEWHDIEFNQIRFDPKSTKIDGKISWSLDGDPEWACPSCGCLISEHAIKNAPAKWIARNPEAYGNGCTRSFWLNAFVSPWTSWTKIVMKFLETKDDPQALQVTYNTLFGQLWEDRGDIADDADLLARREDYGMRNDGSPVELPDGVLVVTCGVDTQDNRLEYEVVGHGRWGETWGIQKGIIHGRPDDDSVWDRLDGVVNHVYRFRDGRGLRISMTCIDSGGHFTQEIYERTRVRQPSRVFAVKGKGGESVPFVSVPSQVPIRDKRVKAWLYTIGVDAGKSQIMSALKVQEPGPKYCHFPLRPECGYDELFFSGLLSEKLVLSKSKTSSKWQWEKLPGHNRNEALDCRNYALAALSIVNPDFDRLEREIKGSTRVEVPKQVKKQTRRRKSALTDAF